MGPLETKLIDKQYVGQMSTPLGWGDPGPWIKYVVLGLVQLSLQLGCSRIAQSPSQCLVHPLFCVEQSAM